MARVAACRLLGLSKQNLLVAYQHRAERRELVGEGSQATRRYCQRLPFDLDNCLVQTHVTVQRSSGIGYAIASHHRSLNHIADLHLDDERDNASGREEDMVN